MRGEGRTFKAQDWCEPRQVGGKGLNRMSRIITGWFRVVMVCPVKLLPDFISCLIVIARINNFILSFS